MKAIFKLAVLVLTTITLQAQNQMYLEIPDIPGESQRMNFEDQIVVDAFAFSVKNPKTKVGSGRVSSRVVFSGIQIHKKTDIATNPMLEGLKQRQRFNEVKLTLVSESGGQGSQAYLVYTLKNVVISAYEIEGTTEDLRPAERWLLEFESINSVYTRTDIDGSAGDSNEFEYSVKSGM
ncbi:MULTISPECIES: type VI secretion system tube protein Hcp [unclassified Leeuwenhoekiella]|uniref:Hcp family type VI secretion system effector n=1 Tax=unclassified Leeuwenhoekiella TaxID=2615029 RepID=UPI000C45E849|nr:MULTISPECIES: type VI secretion system tube protein Hcp [unclassified Leeuwenhoekiella]MAW95310.1 hypothetical protein [Leeuwenhoekiella sp.]MBA81766.1 hypothetical protein [Leeuwenhoekiella sp.]|tara:strand:+ start:19912 stop:20445 length:534 start_codon:yes stop_codon:yes gene_type:complete